MKKHRQRCLGLLIAVCLIALMGLPALAATRELAAKNSTAELTVCPEPRPQMCTRDYRPVCAQRLAGSFKQYPNGCTSCTDPDVAGYRDGECTEGDL